MRILVTRGLGRLLPLLLGAALFAGCIKDDTTGCGQQYSLTVKAYDPDGGDAGAAVQDVILYLFDDTGGFLREIETSVGAEVLLDVSAGGVDIVAWGNLKGGHEQLPVLSPGDSKSAATEQLKPDTRAASLYLSPDDLFYGQLAIPAYDNNLTGEYEIPIRRKVGSMSVTVRGLKQYAGFNDNEYRVVAGETCNAFGFDGNPCGGQASYAPAGAFKTSAGREIYVVAPFNTIPNTQQMNVSIFHAGTLVYTVGSTVDGPITVHEGKHTEVVIDFTATVTVTVTMSPWGSVPSEKEF